MDKRDYLQKLQQLLGDAKDQLLPHITIKYDDDQYEDPEEWWLRPLIDNLEKTIRDLENS